MAQIATKNTKKARNPRKRCACGRAMGKYASRCKKCDKAFYDKLHAEAQATVDTGRCPQCGASLKRNLSIAGWWQCEQYGAVTHRKDPNKPACSWQAFTV